MIRKAENASGVSSLLWIIVFAAFALFMPLREAQAGDGSYIVTDTVESFEYDLVAPHPAYADPVFADEGARFGPFRVVAPHIVEMSGTVDSYSPAQFQRMLQQYPGIRRIEMIDCDGSVDEDANLDLARQIRRAGIDTHVPANGVGSFPVLSSYSLPGSAILPTPARNS